MGLETGTYIYDLVPTNPIGGSDPKSEGDDHIRLLKSTIKAVFPGMAGRAWREQSKSGDYTLLSTDNMTVIACTAALTISGTAATLGNGFTCVLYNAHSAAITAPGGYLLQAGNAILMTTNGSAWRYFPFVLGSMPSVTSLTVNAASGNTRVNTVGGGVIWEWGTKTDGTGYVFTSAAKSFVLETGGVSILTANTTGVYPTNDNARQLGLTTNRWSVVYAVNSVIQTSDKRRKNHIENIKDVGDIVDALQPVRYSWKDTGAVDIGFYAQDLVEYVPEAVEVGNGEVDWGYRSDRLIPFLVAEIQSLRRRVAELESC
jgi:hypothetical protein